MDGKRFRILIADDRFRQVTVCAKSVHLDRLGPHRELGFVPVRDIIRLDEILRFQRDFRLLKSGTLLIVMEFASTEMMPSPDLVWISPTR